jgi:hypothetical protein
MKYLKDIALIYESIDNTIIGYHGSEGNDKFDRPNVKGIWFAEDKDGKQCTYTEQPTRDNYKNFWLSDNKSVRFPDKLSFISWNDTEPFYYEG